MKRTEDQAEFDRMLDEPLGGAGRTPAPFTQEDEAASFMAAQAMIAGG